MNEFGALWADAGGMGLISVRYVEERHVGGCWRSSRVTRL